MSKDSKIAWTDHTFNGWIGCTKVSPGCANCYAERDNIRRKWNPLGWGKGVQRKRTKTWRDPVRWNKQAEAELHDWNRHMIMHGGDAAYPQPRRPRVFCSSLSDWLDDEVPIAWLADLMDLVRATTNLDWLLLTKRPENWDSRISQLAQFRDVGSPQFMWELSWLSGNPPANVWIGTTAEDQQRAEERIPRLLGIPARVRFVSAEPMIGPVDLSVIKFMAGTALIVGDEGGREYAGCSRQMIDWIICGGESGPNARAMQADWARSMRDQCVSNKIAFFFKQWGEWLPQCQYPDLIAEIDPDHWNHAASRDGGLTRHIGKTNSGRLLDGVEWNQFPL